MCSNHGEALESLRTAARHLVGRVPDSGWEAVEESEEILAAIDLLEAALALRVPVVEASGVLEEWGFRSAKQWLRQHCGMRAGRAAERTTLAHELARLPETRTRFTSGELSYGYASTIADAVRPLTDEEVTRAEPILLGLTKEAAADAVSTAGRRIHNHIDPDGTLPRADRQWMRRYLRVIPTFDGMARVDGLLDPELGARLRAALDSYAAPAGQDDTRTRDQRMADALNTLLMSRGVRAEMTVLVDLEVLEGGAGQALLPSGEPIPAEDARRIAANAGVSRLIVGPDSIPLDLGRSARLASPGLRRALQVRDRTCVFEGCDIPAHLCEVDHVVPWALGGRTDRDGTAMCCRAHNLWKNRHPDRVTVERLPGGRVIYRIKRPGDDRPRLPLGSTAA